MATTHRYVMPLVIALAGQKGGVGKSTLAISIAAEWHRRGLRVLVVDADDEQRTAVTWAEVADEQGIDHPRCVPMGENIRTEFVRELGRAQYDVVIIDTPGRLGKRTTFALGVSHVALLPCGPSGPEIWAMAGTLEQAADVATVTGLEVAILITRRQPGTVLGRRVRVVLDDDTEVRVLDTELDQRIAYAEAITGGHGPTTYDSNSDAAREVRRLITELEARYDVHSMTVGTLGRRVARRLGLTSNGRKR
jgi:chromosome partitioning protein